MRIYPCFEHYHTLKHYNKLFPWSVYISVSYVTIHNVTVHTLYALLYSKVLYTIYVPTL